MSTKRTAVITPIEFDNEKVSIVGNNVNRINNIEYIPVAKDGTII